MCYVPVTEDGDKVMRRPIKSLTTKNSEASIQELASLARMIVFARQTAKDLGIEFPTYLLDLAHGAVIEELQRAGGETAATNWSTQEPKGKPLN